MTISSGIRAATRGRLEELFRHGLVTMEFCTAFLREMGYPPEAIEHFMQRLKAIQLEEVT